MTQPIKPTEIQVNQTIGFRYNGRYVQVAVSAIYDNSLSGKLMTDYVGKNETWEKGENKYFYFKSMKKLNLL